MKVVIAPDSFKESLTAKEVCQAIETGLKRVWQDAEFVHVPVADGGEGTVQSLIDATEGKLVELSVTGPLNEAVDAFYGILGDNTTAVIEMAAASGLHHVPHEKRDAKLTTSIGTGELIKHALDNGIRKLIIGLGGSATNDGGIGMLAALGTKFTDNEGRIVTPNGAGLTSITNIDVSEIDSRLADVDILVACDVDNPLCGEHGASATFGKQKGATPEDIMYLDRGLKNFGERVANQLGKEIISVPGAGAAGGMGAALIGFTNATMKAGIDIVVETVQLSKHIEDSDLVITGEGRIDGQTIHGKTPMGVAREAIKHSVPVIAMAGCVGDNYKAVYDVGIQAVFTALPRAMDLQSAFSESSVNLANLAENIARVWSINK